MGLLDVLRTIELFESLSETELTQVAAICSERSLRRGETILKQGDFGNELFIVTAGLLEVLVNRPEETARVMVNLGVGQVIGEMSLIDHGPRSATVRAVSDDARVQVIKHQDFEQLCEQNTRIGYQVMRNLALDLSFKLRHQNLRSNQGVAK